MRPLCRLAVVILFLPLVQPCRAGEAVFAARTVAGKQFEGPLARLDSDWALEVGTRVRRKVAAGELVELRQVGVKLPPLPADEHLVLAGGDCLPFRSLRLTDEKVFIRHPDLEGGKEVSLPLSSVVLIWRLGPDHVVTPEKWRRQLQRARRSRDQVVLRNGDTIEGTLEAITAGGEVAVEAGKKTIKAKWGQVAAIALSSELTDRPRPPAGLVGRLVLTTTEESPGGRLTLTAPRLTGGELRGKTSFGAILRVPLERIALLELAGGKVVPLSELKPSKYDYFPYLGGEKWSWSSDCNVLGRDLRVGGSSHDRGVGTHGHCRLTYSLGGAYRRFEALVGLDDRDGRDGKVRIKVEVDGKAVDLGKKELLSRAAGTWQVVVPLEGAKELTLVVENGDDGPVQAVVNWVRARLVK